MDKSYEEILEYSKKIIERGDGWKALNNYLDLKCNNLVWREEIVEKVKKFESTLDVKGHMRQMPKNTKYDYVLGYGGIVIGVLLVLYCLFFFKNGIIFSTIPFAFIGLGWWQLRK